MASNRFALRELQARNDRSGWGSIVNQYRHLATRKVAAVYIAGDNVRCRRIQSQRSKSLDTSPRENVVLLLCRAQFRNALEVGRYRILPSTRYRTFQNSCIRDLILINGDGCDSMLLDFEVKESRSLRILIGFNSERFKICASNRFWRQRWNKRFC